MIDKYDNKQLKDTYTNKCIKTRNQVRDKLNKSDYSKKRNQKILEQIKKLVDAMI